MKKKMNDKGFTLVELIVVLVILAILAAILVPALLGYIDRAKQSQYVLNAKSVLTAAQAEMSSLYGQSKDPQEINNRLQKVATTADVPDDAEFIVGTEGSATGKEHKDFVITYVYYKESASAPALYFNGTAWEETDTSGSGGWKSATCKVKKESASSTSSGS